MTIDSKGKTLEEIIAEVQKKHPELSVTQQMVMVTGILGVRLDSNGRIQPQLPRLQDILCDHEHKPT